MKPPIEIALPGLLGLHVVWMSATISTAYGSLATTILYPVSLYLDAKYTWADLDIPRDDVAAYISYLGILPFLLLTLTAYIVKSRYLLKTGLPNWKHLAISLIASSLVMTVPWLASSWFFDRHRFALPGDGNWPAISVMTALAAVHAILVVLFIKDVRVCTAAILDQPVDVFPVTSDAGDG